MAIDRLLYERHYWKMGREVIGVDEAGRGPLCGPLVVCGVSFPSGYFNSEIDDSKKLSAKKRSRLFLDILRDAKVYKIVIVSPQQIDKVNIYQATKIAMFSIAKGFNGICLSDCMPLDDLEHLSIVKGDQKSISIAAASIMAKVIRDKVMDGFHILYPKYGFNTHRGYPTKKHLESLQIYGILPIYRKSYNPIKKLLIDRSFINEITDIRDDDYSNKPNSSANT